MHTTLELPLQKRSICHLIRTIHTQIFRKARKGLGKRLWMYTYVRMHYILTSGTDIRNCNAAVWAATLSSQHPPLGHKPHSSPLNDYHCVNTYLSHQSHKNVCKYSLIRRVPDKDGKKRTTSSHIHSHTQNNRQKYCLFVHPVQTSTGMCAPADNFPSGSTHTHTPARLPLNAQHKGSVRCEGSHKSHKRQSGHSKYRILGQQAYRSRGDMVSKAPAAAHSVSVHWSNWGVGRPHSECYITNIAEMESSACLALVLALLASTCKYTGAQDSHGAASSEM